MQAGIYPDMEGFADTWRCECRFTPGMADATRDARYARWQKAVAAAMQV
jgi:glycerol kinase